MSYIGHLWIPVSDLKKSLEFYTNKLGLAEKLTVNLDDEDVDPNLKNAFTVLQTVDEKLSFVLVESKEMLESKGRIIPGWVVKNLESTLKNLKEKGVEFVNEIIDFGEFRYIHFKDLDNNLFQLTQMSEEKN